MEQELEIVEGRRVFGTVVKLAIFLGLLYVAGRYLAQKKNEYADLTESQARTKFVDTVGARLGDDAAEEIADQVIPKLKERGLLKSDPSDESGTSDQGANVGDDAEDDADTVSDAVDSVVKD